MIRQRKLFRSRTAVNCRPEGSFWCRISRNPVEPTTEDCQTSKLIPSYRLPIPIHVMLHRIFLFSVVLLLAIFVGTADAEVASPAKYRHFEQWSNPLTPEWIPIATWLLATISIAAWRLSHNDDVLTQGMRSEFRAWIQGQASPLALTNDRGELLEATDALHKLLGIQVADSETPVEIVAVLKRYCISESSVASINQLQKCLRSQEFSECESRLLSWPGDRWWRVTLHAQLFVGEPRKFWVWSFQDVSQQQRLEQHRAHTERMQSISRLAGGMAHEFNNMLTAMLGNLELMKIDRTKTVEEVIDRIEAAEGAAVRANGLIRDLRRFASRDVTSQQSQLVLPVLANVCRILIRKTQSGIQIHHDLPAGCELKGIFNADQLTEALVKFGENSVEAISSNQGSVTLGAGLVSHNNLELLQIRIRDTGPGMPQATRQRAFEPFFTTKDPAKSSGLGMAIAYGLIAEMNGVVQIEQSSEFGTEIVMTFPTDPAFEPGQTTTRDERSLHVAIAEFDTDVRRSSAAMTSLLGHSTSLLTNCLELATAASGPRPFDVILLSESLPGMALAAMLQELRTVAPKTAVIVVGTGTPDLNVDQLAGQSVPHSVLQKPFTISELSAALANFV